MTTLQIVYKDRKDVKPYFRNPRRNSKARAALIHSLRRYGFRNPLNIDKDGVIITGHARYFAFISGGFQGDIPCLIVDDLSEEEIKAFRIRDNQIQEMSDWDEDALGKEVAKQAGFEHVLAEFKGTLDSAFENVQNIKFPEPDIKAPELHDPTGMIMQNTAIPVVETQPAPAIDNEALHSSANASPPHADEEGEFSDEQMLETAEAPASNSSMETDYDLLEEDSQPSEGAEVGEADAEHTKAEEEYGPEVIMVKCPYCHYEQELVKEG